jgi:uncharacterized SAM-binding protein YcdF (DUF218 family)
MLDKETLELWEILWNYNHLNQIVEKSDLIIVLGSHDTRVADRWIELLKNWYAENILFSGWLWRLTTDNIEFTQSTEAETFAARAIEFWVPRENILIENKSTNTGENIRFSYRLIKDLGIKRLILVQKPYMERRTFATFMKQWPWDHVIMSVTSPDISFKDYPTNHINIEEVINIMVWDTQRVMEYPILWFQIEQEVPDVVLDAYKRLIDHWFTKSCIQKT